jgi:hypothetical protein
MFESVGTSEGSGFLHVVGIGHRQVYVIFRHMLPVLDRGLVSMDMELLSDGECGCGSSEIPGGVQMVLGKRNEK